MTEIKISIAVTGPGSQPAEADASEPDIRQMPSGMETCAAPVLSEPEDVQGLTGGIHLLNRLQSQLEICDIGDPAVKLELEALDGANPDLVDQEVPGDGEAGGDETPAPAGQTRTERLAKPISRRDLLRGSLG